MAKQKRTLLPKTIYGFLAEDCDGDRYLRASDNPSHLVESDETQQVGIYKLLKVVTLKNTTEIID